MSLITISPSRTRKRAGSHSRRTSRPVRNIARAGAPGDAARGAVPESDAAVARRTLHSYECSSDSRGTADCIHVHANYDTRCTVRASPRLAFPHLTSPQGNRNDEGSSRLLASGEITARAKNRRVAQCPTRITKKERKKYTGERERGREGERNQR